MEIKLAQKSTHITTDSINTNSTIEEKETELTISTGNDVLNKLISGYEKDIITTIYGPAGSGKTNFCIMASVDVFNKGKKIIYIDTDSSFSVERLKQVAPNYKEVLANMIFFRPMSFQEQKVTFENLEKIITEKVGLIIIDSIAMLYRLELGNDTAVYDVNRELGKQLTVLNTISRKQNIPILLTNQVYSSLDDKDQVKMVGGNFLKYGSKCLIEIQESENSKTVILRKHRSQSKDKKLNFKIIESGVELIS